MVTTLQKTRGNKEESLPTQTAENSCVMQYCGAVKWCFTEHEDTTPQGSLWRVATAPPDPLNYVTMPSEAKRQTKQKKLKKNKRTKSSSLRRERELSCSRIVLHRTKTRTAQISVLQSVNQSRNIWTGTCCISVIVNSFEQWTSGWLSSHNLFLNDVLVGALLWINVALLNNGKAN